MTTTALTFEEKAFNSQKELLITLIETSLSDYVEFDLHEDLTFLTRFHSKFTGYMLASLVIWPSDSMQYIYFFNLKSLLRMQLNVSFSQFIDVLLIEAKK